MKVKMTFRYVFFSAIVLPLVFAACGGGDQEGEAGEWELDHGYGPITETVDIGALNIELATQGMEYFNSYCMACHAMGTTLVGPNLANTANQRTPEFVMNYMLNPQENRENHPIGQELDDQFPGFMTPTGINQEQARAIFEYLRYYSENGGNP